MSDANPFDSQEWLDYADDAMNEVVPKMADWAVTVALIPKGDTDIKFALELGMSIMMDKPIIAVVATGAAVPAKLVAVADAIVEDDGIGLGLGERIHEVLVRVLRGRA